MNRFEIILLSVWSLISAATLQADDNGSPLIGKKPPELRNVTWLAEESHRLSDFRGKVVLIRWWTAGGCPFCAATASALDAFAEEFASDDLVIIGLYHHKSARPFTVEYVKQQAQRLGYRFLVGIDNEWENLYSWWLGTGDRNWTSVTFLLDHEGIIRSIHPGGVYAPEPTDLFPQAYDDYVDLRSSIAELLRVGAALDK